MLDVPTARQRLIASAIALEGEETVALEDACGRITARVLRAGTDVPPEDNSAMDGYALRSADLADGSSLPVAARIPAGTAPQPLAPGTAARIFTGAVVPAGADAVVMQERCEARDGRVQVEGAVQPGDNVRRTGEDMRAGSEILPAGHRLRAQDLGLLAATGLAKVPVRCRPRVAILSTGDELLPPGRPLAPGCIYESNSAMLAALLRDLGCEVASAQHVADRPDTTRDALARAAGNADLIVSSGGVSVGEEDHVRDAVAALGALDLWKVAVKPGKPLAFGRVGETLFLGLPGNPVSLLVTFLLFGAPLLRAMQGRTELLPQPLALPAAFARERAIGREEYLRVRIDGGRLHAYAQQGSGVLSSTAWASGLARVPAHTTVAEGDALDYYAFGELAY